MAAELPRCQMIHSTDIWKHGGPKISPLPPIEVPVKSLTERVTRVSHIKINIGKTNIDFQIRVCIGLHQDRILTPATWPIVRLNTNRQFQFLVDINFR